MGEANDLTAAIEAARLLPDMTFVLMGDGKRRAELERTAPPNVEFPGPAAGKQDGRRAGGPLERLPDLLQGRARARHQLAQQAVRHVRRRAARRS